MRNEILRKIKKCDKKELLTWISLCQLPEANSEKVAIIEYTIGVLLSIEYDRNPKRKLTRKFIQRILLESYMDFENFVDSLNRSELQRHFPIGFMGMRGDAFPWQFAQTAINRYEPHNKWMDEHLGFTVFDAVNFGKTIAEHIMKKSLQVQCPNFPPPTMEEYYDRKYVMVPGKEHLIFWKNRICMSIDELKSLFPMNKRNQFEKFLKRMSLDNEIEHPEINSPLDFNILYAKPFVRIQKEIFLPIPNLIWSSIASTFHYDLLQDENYRGKYIDQKGKVAEYRTYSCFSKIFPEEQILSRVRYNKDEGFPDVDLVINDNKMTLLVECSAKWITKKAKKGDDTSIITDLKTSIEKCYRQLSRAINTHKEKRISGIKNIQILPIIVVDDFIPGLPNILNVYGFSPDPYPYIINIYDLDVITDLITKQEFIDFIIKRIELSKQKIIFAPDETDYFVLYKTHGFENYTNLFKKGKTKLLYIGHLEDIAPDYYKDHLSQFINDPILSGVIKQKDLERGWS